MSWSVIPEQDETLDVNIDRIWISIRDDLGLHRVICRPGEEEGDRVGRRSDESR